MLSTSIRERNGVVVADLSGRITVGTGEKALRELVEGLLGSGRRHIVLNLGAVEFIDSSGLGELVRALRNTRAADGVLRILNPRGRVYDTLSLARLLPVFEVFESEDAVIGSFARPGSAAGPDGEAELRYRIQGRVATLVLNRPRRFNALTRRMLADLVSALVEVRKDPQVRTVVLTGAGRAFCYGADAEELREEEGVLPTLELFQTVIRDLQGLPKPVIAAINGFATGAGLDLALACDLRVLSERAKLAAAFLKFGLVPDGGSTFFLPRLVGPARAAELVLSARAVNAQEALGWGLVNRVVPPSAVLEEAERWAAELATGPALAQARAKALLSTSPLVGLEEALAAEAREQTACLGGQEFREGLRAHLERRAPSFPE